MLDFICMGSDELFGTGREQKIQNKIYVSSGIRTRPKLVSNSSVIEHFDIIFVSSLLFYPCATRCEGDIVTLLWFRPSVCPCVTLWPCERDRNWTILCIFIKLGTLLNYDERMNPIDFGGQRSKVKVTMDIYGNKLVNTIATKLLCASWSNLADMLAMVRGWTLLILEVRGQRSRSQWTYMEISLWTR